jgi:hypothetical protein
VLGGQWGGTRVGRCPSKLPWLQHPPQAAGRATEGYHPGFRQHRLGQTEREISTWERAMRDHARWLSVALLAMGAHALDMCQFNTIKQEIRDAIPDMLNNNGGRGGGGGGNGRRLSQMTSRR